MMRIFLRMRLTSGVHLLPGSQEADLACDQVALRVAEEARHGLTGLTRSIEWLRLHLQRDVVFNGRGARDRPSPSSDGASLHPASIGIFTRVGLISRESAAEGLGLCYAPASTERRQ
jgi:hypothetical protein